MPNPTSPNPRRLATPALLGGVTPVAVLLVTLVAALALAAPLSAAESGGGAAGGRKLVILGFDGVDARITEQWMNEGKLPNLARLRGQGSFSPLLSTIPSQTPVSWSTFSTGLSPGRHA